MDPQSPSSGRSAGKDEPEVEDVIRDLARFRYALRKFLRFSENGARQCGVTPQQHQLMLGVAGYTGRGLATVSELAEFLQERHHSVMGLVERGQKRRIPFPAAKLEEHLEGVAVGAACLLRVMPSSTRWTMSRCTEIADFVTIFFNAFSRFDYNVTALKSDLPHFRCRVKLLLKHPKAILALSEARNPPAHTSAA